MALTLQKQIDERENQGRKDNYNKDIELYARKDFISRMLNSQPNMKKAHSKIKKLIDINLPSWDNIQTEEELEVVKSLMVDGIVGKLDHEFSFDMDFNGVTHSLKDIKDKQLKERVLKLAVKIPRVIDLMRQSQEIDSVERMGL